MTWKLCKYRLDAIVNNDKKRWNNGKCRCKCKDLVDKGRWDNGLIWNLSICECDKSRDIGQYLGYQICKCRKKLISMLAEEFSEDVNGNKIFHNFFKWFWKSIQFLYNIHSIISHIIHN